MIKKTQWIIGLSGAGKTTLAKTLPTDVMIDGDEVRAGLCSDLGHSASDRCENHRRIAHMCKLLNDQGLSVVVCTIAPLIIHRNIIREILKERVCITWLNTSIEICKERDHKGIYSSNPERLPGVNSLFEDGNDADIII